MQKFTGADPGKSPVREPDPSPAIPLKSMKENN